MNANQNSTENPCNKELLMDHLKVIPIKEELSNPRAVIDYRPLDSVEMVSVAPEPLTVTSLISSHINSQLSTYPLPVMQSLPESHLLSAIVPQHDPYRQAMHTSVVVSNMKEAADSTPESNITMYERTTAAETPPVSNTPSPDSDYHPQHYYQVSHIQPVSREYENSSTVAYDPMMWVTDPMKFQLKEPLDLRGSYVGMENAISAFQNWNVMQQQTSVITDGSGKRILHDYSVQHQSQQSLSFKSPAIVKTSKGLVSTQLISSNRSNTTVKFPNSNVETPVDDQSLVNMTVRELNKKVKGLPKEKQEELKKTRRTLKNRLYAQNCRRKRVQQKGILQIENHKLQNLKSKLIVQLQQITFKKQMLHSKQEELFSKIRFMNSNTTKNIVDTGNYI